MNVSFENRKTYREKKDKFTSQYFLHETKLGTNQRRLSEVKKRLDCMTDGALKLKCFPLETFCCETVENSKFSNILAGLLLNREPTVFPDISLKEQR